MTTRDPNLLKQAASVATTDPHAAYDLLAGTDKTARGVPNLDLARLYCESLQRDAEHLANWFRVVQTKNTPHRRVQDLLMMKGPQFEEIEETLAKLRALVDEMKKGGF